MFRASWRRCTSRTLTTYPFRTNITISRYFTTHTHTVKDETKHIQTQIHGTLPYYTKHLFVATSQPASTWPSVVEKTPSSLLHALVVAQSKHQEACRSHDVILKLTQFQFTSTPTSSSSPSSSPSPYSDHDIIVFPNARVYRHVNVEQADELISHIIQPSLPSTLSSSSIPFHPLHIFICSHTSRDIRCGNAGPPLIEIIHAWNMWRVKHGKEALVKVYACSHVGGHKYAGNVLIFPHGDYFGHVDTSNLFSILIPYITGNAQHAHLIDSTKTTTTTETTTTITSTSTSSSSTSSASISTTTCECDTSTATSLPAPDQLESLFQHIETVVPSSSPSTSITPHLNATRWRGRMGLNKQQQLEWGHQLLTSTSTLTSSIS